MRTGFNNRRGQVFIVSVIIAVTIALITSYALLRYMYQNPNPDQHLGSYQSGMIDAISDGDKTMLYVDQAAKMAVASAWEEYVYGNPKPDLEGDVDESSLPYCGNYVYRLWSAVDKDCYPNYESEDFELGTLINKNIAGLTYLDGSPAPDEGFRYFDQILKKKVTYEFDYLPYENHTTIKGFSNDPYVIYAFMDEKTRESEDILGYIDTKVSFSGGDGDIAGIPYVGVAQGNYLPKDDRDIQYLVIHYTAGSDIAGAMSRFNTPGVYASSHYIIGRDKDSYGIVQPVRDKDVAYHAGCTNIAKYGGCTKEEYKGINTHSIGIEIVNIGYECNNQKYCTNDAKESLCTGPYIVNGETKLSDTCWQRYPDEQYKKIVALSAIIAKRYNIPIDREHIIGHVEIVIKNKVDPGPAMDMDKLVSDISAAASQDESTLNAQLISADPSECLQTENDEWSISDVQLSSTQLTSDQTMKVSINFVNKGATCVNVNPHLTLRGQIKTSTGVKDIVIGEKFPSTNVHKSTDIAPYTSSTITCRFTTDENEYNKYDIGTIFKQPDNTECVLPANLDGSTIKYTITGEDIDATDSNDNEKSYSKDIEFSVSKDTASTASDTGTASTASTGAGATAVEAPIVQLSGPDKSKFDKTKTNIESLGIKTYIEETAADADIPVEIIFGLITQESGGDMHAGSPAGAYGLMQMMEGTFNEVKFSDKCSWAEYQNDAKCQIRAGVATLKAKMASVGSGNTVYYSCNVNCWGQNSKGISGYYQSCTNGCDANKCIGPTDKTYVYTGWEAALRRYNGGGDVKMPSGSAQTSGCIGQPDYEYVEKVMRFASAWGYSATTDSIIKEELHAGIIGSYNIQPTFNVRFPLNFSMFGLLGTFVNSTSKDCGVDNIDKEECIIRHVGDFNKGLSKSYNNSMHLSMICDDNPNALAVNRFVEEINNCVSGGDINCQCDLTSSNANIQNIESMDGYTKISYVYGDRIFDTYMDYEIKNDDGSLLKVKKVSIDGIKLYRSNDDDAPLVYADKGVRQCAISKNKYRLCLKTEYRYQVYDPNAKSRADMIADRDIIVPFAMTVRDAVAPKPVTGLGASNLAHSKDIILLSWDRNIEKDITRYNVYLSDDLTDFNTETRYFKDNTNYITIGSTENNYEEYESIDIEHPICEPQTTDKGIYCRFRYNAVDKDKDKADRDIQIELHKERLYYTNSDNKFIYVIDGTDQRYGFVTDTERFLAMTAVDIDGNEIDNVKTDPDEKIVQGKNLISVTPHDLLEPGLTKIQEYNVDNSFMLRLSWTEITIFIEGSDLSDTLSYDIYLMQGDCTQEQLNDISSSSSQQTSFSNSAEIQLTAPAEGTTVDYCVYVVPKIYNRGYMQGFAVRVSVSG